jgi:transcription termination factor Rho
MSKNTNEESLSDNKTDAEGKATPRKRAAKKAATKTASKATKAATKIATKVVADRIETTTDATPVVKKAVKKTAAKKVAKKAVQATEISAPPEIAAPAPKKKVARIRKSADAPSTSSDTRSGSSTPAQETLQPAHPPVEREEKGPAPRSSAPTHEKRFGRVPGGGPRVSRDSNDEATAASPQASRDENDRPPQGGTVRNPQNRDGGHASHQGHHPSAQRENNDGQQQRESRSKRRREKRKRRLREAQQAGQSGSGNQGNQAGGNRRDPQNRSESSNSLSGERPSTLPSGPKIEVNGMLELAPKGFGFLRVPQKNFEQARDDVFVTPESIRKFNLRVGQWIHGVYQEGMRGPQLVEISSINGMTPEEASKLPHFDELKAINPTRRISFETTPERFTTRVVDIMAPVGRGQRGLIVSPPRSGKTTLLLHMAEAIRQKYEESIHLMVVLVDERPEEVTEFRRALPGAEIYASSNDEQARNHCRIAELAIERAKRLVEAGKDVFLLMDSITRLARAYNGNMNNRGRGTGSGGITIGALEVPRRLFAAARNTRGGGSLTILATALIQTNSRADEAIFMEFKGTGNMELVLDRKIAENYIYPAVDIFKSGTRREELLIPDHMLHKIHLIRRGLSGHRPVEAMERLLFFLKKFPNNPQMLLEIKG